MRMARMRAFAPELIGVGLAVAYVVAVGFASRDLATLLHLHVNRRLIIALFAAAAAALVSIALLITVLVGHARQVTTLAGFIYEPVAKRASLWRRSALWFLANMWPAALIFALIGVVD